MEKEAQIHSLRFANSWMVGPLPSQGQASPPTMTAGRARLAGGIAWLSPYLAVAADDVFVAGELLGADGAGSVCAGGWLPAVPLAHPAIPAAAQQTAAAVHRSLAAPGNVLTTS